VELGVLTIDKAVPMLMREHLVDRSTANPRLASYLLFWCPFFQNTAADVPPLPDIAIHESPPPQISGPPKRDYFREFGLNPV
jgi:hypothetical protein